MNYSVMTEREIEIELNTSVSEGLTSFAAHDLLLDLGRNTPEKTYGKKALTVVLSQFKSLYTIAFIILGIITAVCDFKGSSSAWIMFFAVAVINMVSGFLRDNRERKAALAFDKKRREDVKIIRDSSLMYTDPTLLVKGDIVVLEKGDIVPADLRILWCENLKADESILTKRSVPQEKKSEKMDYEAEGFEENNILYAGTSIASGSARATVIAVGKDTSLAKTVQKKSDKLNMHDRFAQNATSEKYLLLGAILSAIVVLLFVGLREKDVPKALLTASMVSFCIIPAPVAIVRYFALKWAHKRLERNGVQIFNDDVMNTVGEGDYFIFDKGGMLTDEKVELEELVVPHEKALEMAVICSDFSIEGPILKGNSIDVATADYLKNHNTDIKKLIEDNPKLMYTPFDEARKLMAVIIKRGDSYRLIIKGSIEVIPTLCHSLTDNDNTMEMTGEVLHRIENISSSFAEKGLKVRAFAYKDISCLPENIENEINDMVFVGLMGYRESVVSDAKETIKKLKNVHVKPVMVTGDLTITAAAKAKEAGIIESEEECISFRELSDATDEELLEAIDKYSVFSAAAREDRERLVKILTLHGKKVLVAGEEMSHGSVAIYSSATFGEEGDIKCEEEDITKVGGVVHFLRTMRSNMTSASFLAISVGFCEVLVLLYMIVSGMLINVSLKEMILLNLFVTLVPCTVTAFFAGSRMKRENEQLVALECMLTGFISALLCLILLNSPQANIIGYFACFAIFEALRRIVWSIYLDREAENIIGAIILGVALIAVVITGGIMPVEILLSLIASAINGLLEIVKEKGWVRKCMKILSKAETP